jgi:hypothetical protein
MTSIIVYSGTPYILYQLITCVHNVVFTGNIESDSEFGIITYQGSCNSGVIVNELSTGNLFPNWEGSLRYDNSDGNILCIKIYTTNLLLPAHVTLDTSVKYLTCAWYDKLATWVFILIIAGIVACIVFCCIGIYVVVCRSRNNDTAFVRLGENNQSHSIQLTLPNQRIESVSVNNV